MFQMTHFKNNRKLPLTMNINTLNYFNAIVSFRPSKDLETQLRRSMRQAPCQQHLKMHESSTSSAQTLWYWQVLELEAEEYT